MAAPFATNLLGWKKSPMKDGRPSNKRRWRWVPNSADVDNAESLDLAAALLTSLGLADPNLDLPRAATADPPPQNPGVVLENSVLAYLKERLPILDPYRSWLVERGREITYFAQYRHLLGVTEAIAQDPNLRVTIGTDYLIKPDVTVAQLGTPTFNQQPWLHAAIACKWTIRSDRVQNIRHENNNMIRHRRGRLPHLVTVTAEPLPSRLASIARGTGEVDVTYHIAFAELDQAVSASSNQGQKNAWSEVVGQGRLRDFKFIADDLEQW
ncbi:NgoMIV family type II restriction endonuclease [Micromonospora sp. CP22]|uniref:NgoMIV family type II restriction endonuclease n=1 Tax=Micromonospora sp. CP22 TaxID=2580517 RepID=UPI0012BD4858|nr:NgoMIV family type II restriction endonuclease [Micromonospora sp. CP22]MTK05028.1 restriction endonuclease [Micromonospora sp. CP22]